MARPAARELQQRLDNWPDEGGDRCDPERDLGVPVRVLDSSDIAYDVHVRRVFLRAGLAKYDDLTHMVAVARQATLNALGVIDFGGAQTRRRTGRSPGRARAPDPPSHHLGHAPDLLPGRPLRRQALAGRGRRMPGAGNADAGGCPRPIRCATPGQRSPCLPASPSVPWFTPKCA
jgi:hypothetical protein